MKQDNKMSERDGLKPLDELYQVDERNQYIVRFNLRTLELQDNTLEAHYADIETYALQESVPHVIATQFDVARNIYVYAWFEYRFFNAAEASVLTTLELALKERIGDKEINQYINERKKIGKKTGKPDNPSQGLKTLMEYCRDYKLIANKNFSAWHNYPMRQARYKFEQEKFNQAMEEIERTGKSSVPVEPYIAEFLLPDENYDHVQHLIDNVNKIRNIYAHGTTMLHNNVLRSFEMVSEFINQLYPHQSEE